MATGCCNAHPDAGVWLTKTKEAVLKDMHRYCKRNRDGCANASERDFCGCGSNPPKYCRRQLDYATKLCKVYGELDSCLMEAMKAKIRSCPAP